MRKIEEVLSDVRTDCQCESLPYCPMAALLQTARPRLLEQHKLVEVYKVILSEKAGKDVGWNETYLSWADSGMAKKFAEIYSEDKSFKQMKKEMFN